MKRVLLAVGALVAAAAAAQPQPYPNRAIRIVSPYAPGGGTDYFARLIGQKMSETLGVSVVTDNRPGAGGVIGADIVAKSPADGYTLLVSSPSRRYTIPPAEVSVWTRRGSGRRGGRERPVMRRVQPASARRALR